MSSEARERRAMSAAHERHLEPPDDRDPVSGTCPTCKGETDNGEQDAYRDEDGVHRGWSWLPCNACATRCPSCRTANTEKVKDGRCADCAAEESTPTEDTPC